MERNCRALNESKLDHYEEYEKSALHKLIDQTRYTEIKDSVEEYLLNKYPEYKERDSIDLEMRT